MLLIKVRVVVLHKKSQYFTKHNGWIWLWLSAIVVVIDQLSKSLVMDHLQPGDVLRWAPFFNISLAYNTGSAFSFLGSMSGWQMPLFVVIALIVSIGLIIWLGRLRRNSYLLCISLSLIIGGAVGNVIDRLRLSYVIDFFDFHIGSWHFATFNTADAAISIGAILLILHYIFNPK